MSIIAAIWALAMMTPSGRVGYYYFFAYSEYYMGVLSLVALSITIMLGLVATDRLVLSIRQRVLLQSAHRTFGIIAVGALFLHLWTKLMEEHIGIIDVFIPFLRTGNALFVGLGTISAWIMVLSMWTGIVRSKFIGRGKPWMWRSIHATSYLMWPIALVHGLNAGRPAAVWVIVSYVVCILGVLLGLAVRVSVSLNRKKDFASQAGTGAIKPVGQLVPTASPAPKRPGRRGEMESSGARVDGGRGGAPAAVLDRWEPAAPSAREASAAPVSPAVTMSGPPPISAPPYGEERSERRGGRSRRGEEPAEYDEPRALRGRGADPRGGRYAEEEMAPVPRQRRPERAERYEPNERFDEQTGVFSRRAIEAGRRGFDDGDDVPPPPRSRRRPDDERYETQGYEPEPRPRARRFADEEPPPPARRPRAEIEAPRPGRDEEPTRARRFADAEPQSAPRGRYADPEPEPAPRARRFAEDERYDEVPRQRGPRYPEEPPSRARRDDVDRADSGRHSRSEFVDLAGPAYEGDETPTLVDMATRRARRGSQQEAPRGASRGAPRRGRGRTDEGADDDGYWRQLRGEAQ